MDRSAFERLVQEALANVPAPFRTALRDIAVVIEREPTNEQKRTAGLRVDEDLFGLYEGTPRTAREYLPYRLPDKISVFQGPLERACDADAECIKEEVAHTVWHEIGHALGLPEERIEQLEADPPASLREALRAGRDKSETA